MHKVNQMTQRYNYGNIENFQSNNLENKINSLQSLNNWFKYNNNTNKTKMLIF